jgi:hypothetical protein
MSFFNKKKSSEPSGVNWNFPKFNPSELKKDNSHKKKQSKENLIDISVLKNG